MDEVDYSKFIYKKEQTTQISKKPRKKITRKKVLYCFLVIALCFSILFLCVDFFGKGVLSDGIVSLFNTNSVTFFLVTTNHENQTSAYAQSLSAKNRGGAGYIYNDENGYAVIFSIYSSKDDALSVSQKNSNMSFSIKEIVIKSKDKNFNALLSDFVFEINQCVNALDVGQLSENSLFDKINAYKIAFTNLNSKNSKVTDVANFIIQALNAINLGIISRNDLIFQLRYCLCSSIFSAYSLNKV